MHLPRRHFFHWLAADTSKRQAITSRIGLLEQGASGRLRVAGGHLPFPGLGHVKKVPQPWAH